MHNFPIIIFLLYMIVCLFGFFRNANNYSHNIQHKVYVYTPSIKNEDVTDPVTEKMITSKYNNVTLQIYEYNKQIHIDKSNKLNIPSFNQFYQQPYRIFSFFYHIQQVLNMVTEEDTILLARIDIGLNIHHEKINPLLDNYDIILGNAAGAGTQDMWFIFKSKHKHVFMMLYDDYERYLVEYYQCSDLPSTRPEDVFLYHIKKYNLSFVHTNDVIDQQFNHVCSPYCGHNGKNTLT